LVAASTRDVGIDRAVAAETCELPILQDVKDLGLQRRRHLADFVEHHRAVLRELELADARRAGAGERTALVSEQLALEQVGRAVPRNSPSQTVSIAGPIGDATRARRRPCRRRSRHE
jgi:hypothetical protein